MNGTIGKAARIFCVVAGVYVVFLTAGASAQPRPEHGLQYDTPAMVWDEALPLGNGLLGALVWGDGAPLKISLDRTDLWDLRPVPQFSGEDYNYERMRQWVAEGRIEDLHRLYDDPYGNAGPTKIPAGRIELSFEPAGAFQDCALDIAEAMARMRLAYNPNGESSGESNGGPNGKTHGRTEASVFVHAELPVGLIKIATGAKVTPKLVVPPFSGEVTDPAGPGKISAGDLATLGYEAPVVESGEDWTGYVQKGWGGFRFAVAIVWARTEGAWHAAWSVATSDADKDPLALAQACCRDALATGFDPLLDSHSAWWRTYWYRSSISVPNPVLQRQWFLETYKFGAAARADTPPITLQGPWTADNGRIPPWKGDYHHDLNTELSYWPCYSGNRLDGGLGFINWLWKTRHNATDWTRRFFNLAGMNVPMTADLNNNQIGGWHQYTHSATTGAWLAHHFYLHWRYTFDREFLETRAYPYIKDVAIFLEAVTERGEDGLRTLPLSSSPEIHDNRLEAWFPTITNYDLALIRWTFSAAAELAEEIGLDRDAERWRQLHSEFPALARDPEDRRLLVAAGTPLEFSHRHFSHLMAIHPLSMLRWENGEEDRATISASLADLDRLGTDWWTGYSFSWLGCLAARARDGEKAEKAIETFSTAFCLRNGFHCNGDQSGEGHSRFRYRPFTLEGNFAAAAAIQEMLIQSQGGVIRLFPAAPPSWQEASFRKLRAEGAFVVSAERRGGRVVSVAIRSEQGMLCRLEDPFGEKNYKVLGIRHDRVDRKGNELHISFDPGEDVILARMRR